MEYEDEYILPKTYGYMKPCPHCGHRAALWDGNPDGSQGVYVFCEECGMHGPLTIEMEEESAIAAWNALPRRLKWTKEKPTEPGWYWWRFEKNIVPHMVYVVHESTMRPVQTDRMLILYPNSKKELDVETRGGEWAGPIPEPEDA